MLGTLAQMDPLGQRCNGIRHLDHSPVDPLNVCRLQAQSVERLQTVGCLPMAGYQQEYDKGAVLAQSRGRRQPLSAGGAKKHTFRVVLYSE